MIPWIAWNTPTMIIMMAANRMNPTAAPLGSSCARALDGYTSSDICRSLLGVSRPADAAAEMDHLLEGPIGAAHGHHPVGMRFGAAPDRIGDARRQGRELLPRPAASQSVRQDRA